MRSLSILIGLLLAFVTTSYAFPSIDFPILEARKGGKNGTANGQANKAHNGTAKGNSVNKVCSKMAKLTKLTELAANTTKLDALMTKGKLNQTEVDAIKAKAANATTELATMTSNSTLVTECQVVDAHKKVVGECKQMKSLEKLSALAGNQTAMQAYIEKKKLNGTKLEKLQERIGNASTKLTAMQANTTLTSLCASEQKGTTGTTNNGTAASGTGSTTAAQSTGGAAALTLQTMPYVFVPALAGLIAAFL
ncbi:hypothetical protein BDV96DRAFT_600566 [Lophiotrema nucula]|uniref:Uncharacterized protein n=1 Tax=Lophiotrema nucula TaxID=690887 RepID=A0A6A5Z6D3_9PLEO|nr:hypothetical protein BDV96DRAFT_600566 [Lophiotrema nucula]